MRLQLCKDQLVKMSKGKQPGPEVAIQLGAVCGSQVFLLLQHIFRGPSGSRMCALEA